ncbi:MAG TPA: energy transducer TonB [Steroidobacteraceae bacterium]|nr:energy transducer TonB [Steroidobacteraceae bacterium]
MSSPELVDDFSIPYQRSRRYEGASTRVVSFLIVAGLHVLGALAFAAHKMIVEREDPPIAVTLIESSAQDEPQAQPLPAPQFEPARLPIMVMPEVSIDVAPSATAITAVNETLIRTSAPSIAQETFTEARFDADYLDNPQPSYPSISRRMREEGTVVLKVKVRVDGQPDVVLVQQASGSVRLDQAALSAVKLWKFIPAKRGDQAVESWVLVPIEFDLRA